MCASIRSPPLSRVRPRQDGPAGVPVPAEAMAMLASYLTAERNLGRIAADAGIGTLAPTLIGAGHLLLADRDTPPQADAVRKTVTTVVAGVVRQPPR